MSVRPISLRSVALSADASNVDVPPADKTTTNKLIIVGVSDFHTKLVLDFRLCGVFAIKYIKVENYLDQLLTQRVIVHFTYVLARDTNFYFYRYNS